MGKQILIEEVKNGFIVTEDFQIHNDPRIIYNAEVPVRLVFNTHDQLNEYINNNIGMQPARPEEKEKLKKVPERHYKSEAIAVDPNEL